VTIGGSKNDALAILVGAILVPGVTILHNVPANSDVLNLLEIFQQIGVRARFLSESSLELDASALTTSETPQDRVRQMRASFNLLGALIARFGQAEVAKPGGCNIGARPVNFHVKGLEQLGAKLHLEHGVYYGKAERFLGANISLEFPSAGTTQHLMIAACCALGRTIIENCAAEPEVVNLADFLNACGAQIHGAGTPTITIEGVKELHPAEYAIIPDRMQAGTYAIAAAITGGDVLVRDAVYDHCRPLFAKMLEAGVQIDSDARGVRVRRSARNILSTDIMTMPHPGFPTDMQSIMGAMLSIADGTSVVTETIYENRFRYTMELAKMGAEIRISGRNAIITGVPRLSGAPVACPDLRGGAALVIAGLAAEGETRIADLYHLDRGYEGMVKKLNSLGADIERCAEPEGTQLCST
jgi:UDP-N-acetylglucosamine 1-carboxyvinyltransferase